MNNFECLNVKRFFNKNLGSSQRYTGFTLAEVLITLGIIGIVAGMTIPTLMQNYQKQQYVVQLKVAYSTLSQGFQQMAADAGCPGDLSCFFTTSNPTIMGNKIASYFKGSKTCPPGDTSIFNDEEKCMEIQMHGGSMEDWEACEQDLVNKYNASKTHGCFGEKNLKYYNLGGTLLTSDGSGNIADAYSFLTMNNFSVGLSVSPISGGGGPIENCNGGICYYSICVDVNGPKPPNTVGRDLFNFTLYKNGELKFSQSSSNSLGIDTKHCSTDKNDDLYYPKWVCTKKIMEEGWQMNY